MNMPGLDEVAKHLFRDETELVRKLADRARLDAGQASEVAVLARRLVEAVRKGRKQAGGIEEFMQEYALSSKEGIVLMCLAEALLRIPDAQTADKLIADKIGSASWQAHLGKSDSLLVNASTWGLMLTGRVLEAGTEKPDDIAGYLSRMIKRSGEPVIRNAMRHAMRIMGKQFVLGRTITEALETAKPLQSRGFRFSYDMLGEAARTMADAERYRNAYASALQAVGKSVKGMRERDDIFARPSISIKLSALHPRFEAIKKERVLHELLPVVLELAKQAKDLQLGLTIDAEEMDRLELTLEVFWLLCRDEGLADWNGLGLAVQAYSRRALPVLAWLDKVAGLTKRRIAVRLVKGAYWDSEIKLAQVGGFESFPVFTRKPSTDVSYLACARFLLARADSFYPQFASHNAQTLASVSVMAGDGTEFECQRLHGMGQALFEQVISPDGLNRPARIYAPVGSHEDLLAYLVRRLLENGANSSFVNRLADDEMPIEEIIADPVSRVDKYSQVPHPGIAPPSDIFRPRRNSSGFPVWDVSRRSAVLDEVRQALDDKVAAAGLINGKRVSGKARPIRAPFDHGTSPGTVVEANNTDVDEALQVSRAAYEDWSLAGGSARADILEKAADLYQKNAARLLSLLMCEAGKTLANAQADLREAIDFLRYYAEQARAQFSSPEQLPGPTGERNQLFLKARGVFACISPWNFPLAIFTGQVSAALAAGNAALAKPAEQTPLVAYEAVRLMHAAGVPVEVLHYLPGDGAVIGAHMVSKPGIGGVVFTGSNETAGLIHQAMAARKGPIVPFIAETGGINAMVADSSALPEQVVRDCLQSAFDSAGQRCSAARILYVQKELAQRLVPMLQGAVEELRIGSPMNIATDIGPVIDKQAQDVLLEHKRRMAASAVTLIDLMLPAETNAGTFVSPAIYQLDDPAMLTREVFGPVLHLVEFSAGDQDKVIETINASGYGLTFGLHTRIEKTAEYYARNIRAGNIYVNRNQIGAVVGSQPFGGEGLSGTGPKAGGPQYLARFATERVVSTDTTASGGNAALLSLEADSREN